MIKNILVLSSSFPVKMFYKEFSESLNVNSNTRLTLIHKENEWNKFNFKHENFELININSIESTISKINLRHDLSSIIHKIIMDNNTFLMFDRVSYRKNYILGVKNYVDDISISVYQIYNFLKNRKTDIIFFRTTPHSIFEWTFAHVAEYLKIQVLLCEPTILPWRFKLVSGFRNERRIINLKKVSSESNNLINEFLKNKSGKYELGIPGYEKIRLKKNKGKIYNAYIDFKKWYKNPVFLINKYKCYKRLEKLSISKEFINKKYAIFFLHYQPERTTLPEGYKYSSQLIAIQKLRSQLPEEITLVVKEHPSIFTNKCDPRQRLPEFYNKILQIKNTVLININQNSYDLIDDACLTATITGTVGIESVIRGTPVLFFGKSILDEGYGIHLINDKMNNLKSFLMKCINNDFEGHLIKKEITNQINNQILNSTSGLSNSQNIDNYILNRDFGHIQVLKKILQNKYEIS